MRRYLTIGLPLTAYIFFFLDNHSNPWVVNLVHCFQDADFLYLVMEYMPGGDLMEHLIRRDVFVRHLYLQAMVE